MKNKIEQYLNEIIKCHEVKHQIYMAYLFMSITCANVLINLIFSQFNKYSIIITAIILSILFIVFLYTLKHLKQKYRKTIQNLQNLHPIEGEQGAMKILKKNINDNIKNVFGKKFLGLKKFMPNQSKK